MKKVAILLIFTMLSLISLGSVGNLAMAQEVDWDDYRTAGENRYETAFEIAKEFNANPEQVIIVRGDTEDGMPQIVDGLTASSLAGHFNAPILLVQQDRLPPDTIAALEALDPSEVFIIGGLNAIHQTVEDGISAMNIETTRIAGENRYETAAAISMEFEAAVNNTALITNGNDQNLVDSLAAGPLAFLGHPILLVNNQRGEVPQETLDAIEALGVEELIIVGGPAAVSEDIEDLLDSVEGVSVLPRLAGENRYETSVKIAEFAAFADMDIAYLVNGYGNQFVDAVPSSTLGAPVLYFNGQREVILESVVNHLRSINEFKAIGGIMVATDAILTRAMQVIGVPLMMPTVQVVFGMDRINSEYWVPDSTVDITIERSDETVLTHTVTADQDGKFYILLSTLDTTYEFMSGDTLTATDHDELEVIYNMRFIEVTDIDVEANTVTGKADPNQEVEVYIDTSEAGDSYDEMPRVMVDANNDGEWTVDFTDQWDMWEGMYGGAMVSNAEGNSSIHYWDSTVAHISAYPHENNITGYGWHEEVILTIDGTDTYTVAINDFGFFDFNQSDQGAIVLEAGNEITATDGVTTYTFEVAALEISDVNRSSGVISGTAEAGGEVNLTISTPRMQAGGGPPTIVVEETLNVDAQGEWVYDYNQTIAENDDIYVTVYSSTHGELANTMDRDLGEYSSN